MHAAAVDKDHENQNVVVSVRESPKTECSAALVDLDGGFLVSEPVYCDAHREQFAEEAHEAE